ncbi:MAG: hypothetical protein D6820_08495 [Lentisphaerae bacterium]|nr:MAG: hypothetical protein D6820_08495 [Lentisphaerota bacterium]
MVNREDIMGWFATTGTKIAVVTIDTALTYCVCPAGNKQKNREHHRLLDDDPDSNVLKLANRFSSTQ